MSKISAGSCRFGESAPTVSREAGRGPVGPGARSWPNAERTIYADFCKEYLSRTGFNPAANGKKSYPPRQGGSRRQRRLTKLSATDSAHAFEWLVLLTGGPSREDIPARLR